MTCKRCGCTDTHACTSQCADGEIRACSWVRPGLCSFCFYAMADEIYQETIQVEPLIIIPERELILS